MNNFFVSIIKTRMEPSLRGTKPSVYMEFSLNEASSLRSAQRLAVPILILFRVILYFLKLYREPS